MIITAPTGVAAINAGGVTLHSFFQLPFGPFVPGAALLRFYTAHASLHRWIGKSAFAPVISTPVFYTFQESSWRM